MVIAGFCILISVMFRYNFVPSYLSHLAINNSTAIFFFIIFIDSPRVVRLLPGVNFYKRFFHRCWLSD